MQTDYALKVEAYENWQLLARQVEAAWKWRTEQLQAGTLPEPLATIRDEHRSYMAKAMYRIATEYGLWTEAPCPAGRRRRNASTCGQWCDECGGYQTVRVVRAPVREEVTA